MKEIFSYVTLMTGAMIAAFSIEEFLVPCTILDGGIVGISIIAKSAVAMVTFSSFLGIFEPLTDVTRDYLLAVCFGGVFLGIGVEQAKAAMIITNEGHKIADEIYQLKQLINEVDASAFITVSDVSEIIGNHIKKKANIDEL